jgi:NAD(P)-dependent dehydrogenase (short-subunit alcohol dehydrogenase family)
MLLYGASLIYGYSGSVSFSDVAAAVLFLATSADFITGQVISVDGGQSSA